MRGFRGLRLPSGVASSLGVRAGEKVVAWGSNTESGKATYAIATSRALYVLSERIPWHRISRASWAEPVLEVAVLADEDRPGRTLRIELDAARDLPPAVHDRVDDSVMISERVEFTESAGARMVARRDSEDASIHWSVVFDAGLDPANPDLRAAADEALDRLRVSLGI